MYGLVCLDFPQADHLPGGVRLHLDRRTWLQPESDGPRATSGGRPARVSSLGRDEHLRVGSVRDAPDPEELEDVRGHGQSLREWCAYMCQHTTLGLSPFPTPLLEREG